MSESEAPNPEPPIPPLEEARCAPRRGDWFVGLSAIVLAGVVAAVAGEAVFGAFNLPPRAGSGMQVLPPEELAKNLAEDIRADQLNCGAAYGILGAALGLTLGLLGGRLRGCAGAAIGAGLAGLVLGGAAGALAMAPMIPVYRAHYTADETDFTVPMLTHGVVWVAIGLAAGLALGLGRGGPRKALPAALGGALGGLVGTMVYEPGAAMLFPLAKSTHPIAEQWTARVFAMLVIALAVGVCALIAVQDAPARKPAPQPDPDIPRETAA